MQTRNSRGRPRAGRPIWLPITGRNRTKTGKSHNPGFARGPARAIVNAFRCIRCSALPPFVPSPSRSRIYPTSADLKCRTRAGPSSVWERAQWCGHDFEWVRGEFRNNVPLTHHRMRQRRAALSRKGRGRNNDRRTRGLSPMEVLRGHCNARVRHDAFDASRRPLTAHTFELQFPLLITSRKQWRGSDHT